MKKSIKPFIYVTIEISGICNAQCKYCATGARSALPGSMMKLDFFKKTLDKLIEVGAVKSGETTIGLFNKGEPFLNPEFGEILDYIIKKGLNFSLSSNFNVYKKLTPQQIASCIDLIISVPGWSQRSYDKVHKFDFEHIKENILKFKKDFSEQNQTSKLYLTYHLYQYNLDELISAIQFSQKNGLTFYSYYAHIIDYWKIKKYVEKKLTPEEEKDISQSLFITHLEKQLNNIPSNYVCPQSASLNIDEKGNILTCCVLPNNHPDYTRGNLFDEETDVIELIQTRQTVPECSTCIKFGISHLLHSFTEVPDFVKKLEEANTTTIKERPQEMSISETLEIIIPTFNRSQTLEKTLTTLLNSPLKECKITVLNNNSIDDTEVMCLKLKEKYANIHYIKNRYNLGLAGNLCKGLTLPEKKYFWILFDDTGLDFTHWEDIEKGINSDFDCILTTNYYKARDLTNTLDKATVYLMLIYMFSGIYKSDLITDDVILYALTDIYTIHPQMALISKLFNENKRIYIPQNTITFPQMNPEIHEGKEYSFNRAKKTFFHFRVSGLKFFPGFLNAIQSLKDVQLKETCIRLLFMSYHDTGPYVDLKQISLQNETFLNLCDIFRWLPKKERRILFFSLLKKDSFRKEKTAKRKIWYIFGIKVLSIKRWKRKGNDNKR